MTIEEMKKRTIRLYEALCLFENTIDVDLTDYYDNVIICQDLLFRALADGGFTDEE